MAALAPICAASSRVGARMRTRARLRRRLPLVQGQVLQDGQGEGGGLAGAGLGAADQVAALEQMGDGLGLDGSGDGVALFGHRPLQFRQQRGEHAGGGWLIQAGMANVRLPSCGPLAGLGYGRNFFFDLHHISLL